MNCFQILLSSGRRTTPLGKSASSFSLWIAFKFYYLRDEEQQQSHVTENRNSCELLSNFIIFGTKNNESCSLPKVFSVVNCFQILLSSGRRTTFSNKWVCVVWLWIAFKFYYLRDEEQLIDHIIEDYIGCELLSNFIIFGTKNN